MPKIIIADLPVDVTFSKAEMKALFGGGGQSMITVAGFDKMHRLTRGTESRTWSSRDKSNIFYSDVNTGALKLCSD